MSFLEYCLDPPKDSCVQYSRRPCPNSDITGPGQQWSMFISATVFCIVILFAPNDFRVATYTYLANTISLLLTGLIKLRDGRLTQNDTVFLLILTFSPATIYLLFINLCVIYGNFPKRIAGLEAFEKLFLIVLSTLLIGLWIGIFGILISDFDNYSESGCNRLYGKRAFIALSWPLPFILQALCSIAILILIALFKLSRLQDPSVHHQEPSEDIITWTRNLFKENDGFPESTRHGMACLFILLQAVRFCESDVVDTYGGEVFESWGGYPLTMVTNSIGNIFIGTISVFFIWTSPIGPHIRLIMTLFITVSMGLGEASFIYLSIGDFIIGGWVWIIWWKCTAGWRRRYGVCFGIAILILFTILSKTNMPDFQPIFSLQLWWFCAWEISCFKPPSSRLDTFVQLWLNSTDRLPIFTILYLIMAPIIAWMQAVMTASPTNANVMTFGQMSAIMNAAMSVSSLIGTCWGNRQSIWEALYILEDNSQQNSSQQHTYFGSDFVELSHMDVSSRPAIYPYPPGFLPN